MTSKATTLLDSAYREHTDENSHKQGLTFQAELVGIQDEAGKRLQKRNLIGKDCTPMGNIRERTQKVTIDRPQWAMSKGRSQRRYSTPSYE